MQPTYQERFDRLTARAGDPGLRAPTMGIERECLRVQADGRIARTPHPPALGAALTNPFITTDYSEALLELITPPCRGSGPSLEFLNDIHRFVDARLEAGELLWSNSMPCVVGGDDDVPIAEYGSSNVGAMKRIYRVGLGYRYGRTMQAIAGVHFNYSPPPAVLAAWYGEEGMSERQRLLSDALLGMVRNLRRHGWLVLYLFGASPAVCRSFFSDRAGPGDLGLEVMANGTAYLPHATSLRMSDLGYSNKAQAGVQVSANSLREYIDGLTHAITTPWPDYERIGVRVDGQYRQLNANLLQIENEYYSLVRPKRVAQSGESPTQALRRGGVEYVELRALDVDPFSPTGVNEDQLRVLEAFMLYCLLTDSPPIDGQEEKSLAANTRRVAREGRAPGCTLSDGHGRQTSLRDAALRLVDGMLHMTEHVFGGAGTDVHHALMRQRAAIVEPSLTPSARVLEEITSRDESFVEMALRLSRWHRDALRAQGPLPPAMLAVLEHEVRRSHKRQREIEANDQLSFEQYLHAYYSQTRRR